MKKKLLILLLALLAVFGAAHALFLFPGGQPVLRTSAEADLRDQALTVSDYQTLAEKLPRCHILWNIPIGGAVYDCTDNRITIDSLQETSIPLFAYFDDLREVDARECRDYDALLELQAALPDCEIRWAVHLGSGALSPESTDLELEGTGVTAGELLENLQYFPNLETASLTDAAFTPEEHRTLREAYPSVRFIWYVEAAGKSWLSTEQTLSYAGENPNIAALVAAAPGFYDVREIDLTGWGCTVEELLAVREAFGGAFVRSEVTLYDVTFPTDAEALDFSGIPLEDTAAVERVLPLMPNLTKVEMCDCGIPSEEMDALGQRNPQVRFIWTVMIGKAKIRTDITGYIGAKHGYLPNATIRDPYQDAAHRLFNEDVEEFKYCVDMVVMDLGHMGVTDYSFLNYMPKLKYLILADTPGTDFSMISNLTELIYLELFMTEFDDVELLLNLENLEDLNLGFTRLSNPELLKEMTWLDRLWLPGTRLSKSTYQEIQAALPDTVMDYTSTDSTSNGWRKSQNYYDMRDLLGMYYLS